MEKLKLSLPGMLEQSFDPETYGKIRADTINTTVGNEEGYDCKECLNRGFVAEPLPDGNVKILRCRCMRIRSCIREMERSGLKNSIREQTFEAFQATTPWQKTLKAGIEAYARQEEGWLLVGGQPGSGKTHLCTAVCRQRLLDGKKLIYMPWREKVAQLKALALDAQKRGELMDSWKNVQVLYIDDLFKTGNGPEGSAMPTQADIALAFELLNHRYLNRLATIISTERTPQELVRIDEALGSRIIEAAGQHIYSIARDQKRNYRLRAIVDL